MFSQMVSYEFLLHGALHGYFLYLVCAPPEKPTKRCEPEEHCLRFSKYTSHELRIDFRCKGSCKGPYTITAVSDYNARYNVTL